MNVRYVIWNDTYGMYVKTNVLVQNSAYLSTVEHTYDREEAYSTKNRTVASSAASRLRRSMESCDFEVHGVDENGEVVFVSKHHKANIYNKDVADICVNCPYDTCRTRCERYREGYKRVADSIERNSRGG